MSNTFENFIREHRNELDVYTPSAAVWNGIEAGINHPTFIKSKVSWLKYAGFSASVIAVLVYLKVNSSGPDTMEAYSAEQKIQTTTITATAVPVVAPAETKANAILPIPAIESAEATKSNLQPVMATSPAPAQESKSAAAPAVTASPETAVSPAVNRSAAPAPPYASSGMWSASKDTLKIDTTFSGIKKIEIESSSFDINVASAAGDKVSFKANSRSQTHGIVIAKRKRSIKYEVKDEILRITEEKESGSLGVVGCQTQESAVLNFEVPANTDVMIHSSYGDVKLSGLQGKLCNINARSGDVKLENLSTELTLAMGYGDLSATGITGNVSGKVSSGDISFTDLKGNMNIETSYGDQQYKNVTGNIKAQCSSGDLKITGMKGNADIDSKYGDIVLEDFKGNPVLHTTSGDIRGKNVELMEKMEANTNYGDIKMKFVNSLSALSFDLETNYGNINIDMDGQKMEEDKKLVLKNGNILIKAHTSSGDQSYK